MQAFDFRLDHLADLVDDLLERILAVADVPRRDPAFGVGAASPP